MRPPHEKPTGSSPAAPARDLYETLNVPRQASAKEIRRAYRVLARKYHPDLNPGDATAAQKFREVQEAYEVLSNSAKRKAYDYYGTDFADRIPRRTPPSAYQERASRPRTTPSPARSAARSTAAGYPFRSPGTFPRLVSGARLGSLAVAFVFVAGTFVYLLWPDPAVPEFKRAREALRHVTSWKVQGQMNMSGPSTGDFVDEVSCPANEHIVQHMRSTSGAEPVETTFETIVIGNDRYFSYGRANTWTRVPAGGFGPSSKCASLERGEDAAAMPTLVRWLNSSYVISKKEKRKTVDGDCREWEIVSPGGFSRVANAEFVCLGVKDHLPMFQGAPGSPAEMRFYDWNVPIEIVPPDLSASQ